MLICSRTVNGDRDTLKENIAISADKSRNLRKRVVIEVLLGWISCVGLDNLNLKVVGLRHGEDGR